MGRSVKETQNTTRRSTTKPSILFVAVIGVLAIAWAGWWMLWSPVRLHERDYDTVLALYRVCNQRNIEGLEQIESQLFGPTMASPNVSASRVAVENVIRKAKSGRWDDAQRDCRRLLEDQVLR